MAMVTVAIAQPKIDLYLIYKDGCPACAQMERKLQHPQIAPILKRSFRLHRIERAHQDQLPKLFMHTHTFPTLLFLNGQKDEIVSRIHNVSIGELRRVLLEAETVVGMTP